MTEQIATEQPLDTVVPATFLSLTAILEQAGYDVLPIPADQETPFDQLLVLLDPDEEGRNISLRLCWLDDIVETSAAKAGVELTGEDGLLPDESGTLEFFVLIPIPIESSKAGDVAYLAHLFSRSLPLGVFGLSPDGKLYFRYCLLQQDRTVDEELILNLMGFFSYNIRQFNDKVTKLTLGIQSVPELMAEMKHGGSQPA